MKIRRPNWVSLCFVVFLLPGFNSICEAFQSVEGDASAPEIALQVDTKKTQADKPRDQTRFLRVQSDEFDNPVALQTATTKYVLKNDKGEVQFEVFLESVIHIADASYYRGFQHRFEQYDTVLYELVADQPKTDKSKEEELPGAFQLFQQISTGTLGLAYQLEEVDYNAKNMLHADLSQNEMAKRMAERGETKTTLLIDLLAHIIKQVSAEQQNQRAPTRNDTEASGGRKSLNLDMSLLTDPDGIMKIRQMMATTLVKSQLLDSSFPPSFHRLIIGDRNDRVMSVLNKEKKKGKRRVAIFYGAGHMADFEKRLVEEYGMELDKVIWRSAWDLRDGAIPGGPLEGLIESTFRDSIKNKLRQFAIGQKDKMEAEKSKEAAESEKDEKLKAMEETLKALEAKLKQLESDKIEKSKKSEVSDNSKREKKNKDDDKSAG